MCLTQVCPCAVGLVDVVIGLGETRQLPQEILMKRAESGMFDRLGGLKIVTCMEQCQPIPDAIKPRHVTCATNKFEYIVLPIGIFRR